jgi:IS605 OrfB family transposase
MLVTRAVKGKLMGAGVTACARVGGQTRYLWNKFVELNNARMKAEGKFIFYAELSAMLPKLLKEDAKLIGLPHRCAQMQAMNFERTLKNYIKNKAEFQRIDARRTAKSAARVAKGLPPLKPKKSGIPQFKRYDDRADAFSFVGRECRVEPRRVRLPKIGWVSVRGLDIPAGAELKQVAVTQEPTGWHVSVQFDAPVKEFDVPTRAVIGIDQGLTTLLALASSEKIEPPRYARKAEKHIRRLNRERDRRRKGSVNRRRTVARLGREHRLVRNLRMDFLHKLTSRMVDTFEGFAVEDLNLKALMKTRLAKSFADASLGELLRMLRYKSEWACREWRVLGRFKRSTGVCPEEDCGWIGPRLRPGIATWTCGGCGAIHDRDHAASRVILRDATVVRAAGVAPARREPVRAFGRKRSAAVYGGIEVGASVSHGGPLSNVAGAPLDKAV